MLSTRTDFNIGISYDIGHITTAVDIADSADGKDAIALFWPIFRHDVVTSPKHITIRIFMFTDKILFHILCENPTRFHVDINMRTAN